MQVVVSTFCYSVFPTTTVRSASIVVSLSLSPLSLLENKYMMNMKRMALESHLEILWEIFLCQFQNILLSLQNC